NQLMAHHGIIFKPQEKMVWVSANPYQMGEFVCYNLDSVFNERKNGAVLSFEEEKQNIAKDPFLETAAFKNYQKFRIEDHKKDTYLRNKKEIHFD
ncbi:acyl-CoA--6-aminopenicillanic acid acyl-transferase, partial [Flavobacterium circumlabens]